MANNDVMNLGFNFGQEPVQGTVTQESYDAGHSSFSDLFQGKFNSFNPEAIVSGGNNKLKSGMFDMEVEESDLAFGYKQPNPPLTPKTPGRFS